MSIEIVEAIDKTIPLQVVTPETPEEDILELNRLLTGKDVERESGFIVPSPNLIEIFLAGGITGCSNWQDEVIDILKQKSNMNNVVIYNPRCKNFDVTNPNAAANQITWEYEHLNIVDIFTMYFDGGESIQPICMYELGKYIQKIIDEERSLKYAAQRIAVSVDANYKRKMDVFYQMNADFNKFGRSSDLLNSVLQLDVSVEQHAEFIYNQIQKYRGLTTHSLPKRLIYI